MKTNFKKLPKSQIEIDFELDELEFQKYIEKTLEHLKNHVKIDGFRPSHVPKEMIEEKVGQENLLMEAGDLAVKETYTKYVNENNLEPVGSPEVQIKKIARGSEFLFTVKISVLLEIELPDYKEIASKIKGNEIHVDEKEVDDAINYLQKSRAKFSQVDRGAGIKDFIEIEYQNKNINNGKEIKDKFVLGEGGFMKDFENNIIGMEAGEEREFNARFPNNAPNKELAGKESNFKVKMVSVQKMDLPEINNEFAKSLGNFTDLIALKENLREGITIEKRESEKQRKRGEILSKISDKINFNFPGKIIEYEQSRLFENFKSKVEQSFSASASPGKRITFEEYLASIKKTEDEIKKSFAPEAEKTVKNFLILRQIGKAENIKISDEELEKGMSEVVKNYSKEQLGKIDINQLKEYTKDAIYNEKIFQLLENF